MRNILVTNGEDLHIAFKSYIMNFIGSPKIMSVPFLYSEI